MALGGAAAQGGRTRQALPDSFSDNIVKMTAVAVDNQNVCVMMAGNEMSLLEEDWLSFRVVPLSHRTRLRLLNIGSLAIR